MNQHISDDDMTTKILPTLNDVLECQFSSWYPKFSNLTTKYNGRRNVTIKSQIIQPLPIEFIEYLVSKKNQRFILPQNARTSSVLLEANNHRNDTDAWSSSSCDSEKNNNHCHDNDATDDDDDDEASSSSSTTTHTYSFAELNDQINSAIRSFSNMACIPKLNWSSPKDAVWINGNTNSMECRTAGDVYLLLKASDFIMYDLQYALVDVVADVDTSSCHPTTTTSTPTVTSNTTITPDDNDDGVDVLRHVELDDNISTTQHHIIAANRTTTSTTTVTSDKCDDGNSNNNLSNFRYELVLRKYCNLYPSQEFRCFVSNNTIVGISQRYQQYYFSFLQDIYRNKEYSDLIYDFFLNVLQPNIATTATTTTTLEQYVVDLYIDQQQRIWMIDLNVWGTRTDAILFHWSELVKFANGAKIRQQQQPNSVEEPIDDIVRNIEFRIVDQSSSSNSTTSTNQPQPQPQILPNPLSNYKAPMDALFLGNKNHGDAGNNTTTTFQDFMNLCVRPSSIQNQRNQSSNNNNTNDSTNYNSSSDGSDTEE